MTTRHEVFVYHDSRTHKETQLDVRMLRGLCSMYMEPVEIGFPHAYREALRIGNDVDPVRAAALTPAQLALPPILLDFGTNEHGVPEMIPADGAHRLWRLLGEADPATPGALIKCYVVPWAEAVDLAGIKPGEVALAPIAGYDPAAHRARVQRYFTALEAQRQQQEQGNQG